MGHCLVVTADDFGSAASVNRAVETAHRGGILGRASLMVAAPAFADAVERARLMPTLSTGLHLVLCDGRAVSAPEEIPDLSDEAGCFVDSPLRAGWIYWRRRRRIREQLERELRAQFERYLESGLPLDHVDGHHHLHVHPIVFDVLEPLLSEYAVPAFRLPREDCAGSLRGTVPPEDAVAPVFSALARRRRRRGVVGGRAAVAARVLEADRRGRPRAKRLLELASRISAERVELYTHPDDATAAGKIERDALCAPAVREAFERAGYRIVCRLRDAAEEQPPR